jgi:predicted phosphodiesterase
VRLAVLSDIHSNLEALEAALAEVRRAGVDAIVSCGDLVGYNADPNAVLDRVRGLGVLSVMGNHDAAACGLEEPDLFNHAAREAVLWTREVLSPVNRDFLRRLPVHRDLGEGLLLAHGSWLDRDAYVFEAADTARDFEALEHELPDARVLLLGHTHYPIAFARERGSARTETDLSERIGLRPGRMSFVNVGSVGQPRDGDPRLSLAIVDTGEGSVERRRVEYPVEETARKVQEAGLPEYLARRLLVGR